MNTTVEEELLDRRSIVLYTTNFIDEVVDSRQITDEMLKEFHENISSYSVNVDYTIDHYKRSVNPDPTGANDFYVTYVKVGYNQPWEKGDRITVRISTIGYSTVQTLSHKLAGIFIPEMDRTFSARIR